MLKEKEGGANTHLLGLKVRWTIYLRRSSRKKDDQVRGKFYNFTPPDERVQIDGIG